MDGVDMNVSLAQSEDLLAASGSVTVRISQSSGASLVLSVPMGAAVEEISQEGTGCQQCHCDDPGPKSEQERRASPRSAAEWERIQDPPAARSLVEEQKAPEEQKPGPLETEGPQGPELGEQKPDQLETEGPQGPELGEPKPSQRETEGPQGPELGEPKPGQLETEGPQGPELGEPKPSQRETDGPQGPELGEPKPGQLETEGPRDPELGEPKPGQLETEGPQGPELGEEAPGPKDVACDACLESTPHKAVKSCLTCLVSYCQAHLRPHLENSKFHNHRLVEPLRDIERRTCEGHGQPLELYCPAEACCVCVCQECEEAAHQGHALIPLTEARRDMEKELQEKVEDMMNMVTAVEKAINKLQTNTISIKSSVTEVRSGMELRFAALQAAMGKVLEDVREILRAEERQAVQRADGIQTHLEKKLSEVHRAQARAEKLSRNKNDIDFLEEYSLWRKDVVDVTVPSVYIGLIDRLAVFDHMVTESTQELSGQLLPAYRDKLKEAFKCVKLGVKSTAGVLNTGPSEEPEPETREDFLKYGTVLSFDADTAHSYLRLMEKSRKATNTTPWQHSYPDGPGRFAHWRQVLAAESFCLGRHYFEVEFGGDGVHVGVTYKSIDRKSEKSNGCITGNDFSWCLEWSGAFSAWHSDVETPLKVAEGFSRIGVYVDYDKGLLAFYGVSSSMTLIHKYQAEFMEPLYPAFWLSKKENVVLLVSPWDDFLSQPPKPSSL
ncbi:tripartite motif-containing protein 16-like [Conger conger]|uniref:tripartite motif-containing protein 16-like n=1 Tax=Conger conger TaxID=82655 RepID=UPI002A5A7099|nr:tripartite motif-containing protein 16-like [Conger conger]